MAADAIDAVVFDIGGVLIDWDPRYLYRQLFADAGEMEDFLATVCTGEWHRAHDLGADIAGSCQLLARQFPRYEAMIMAWAERGEEMAAGQFGDTVAVLAELIEAGMPCYAVSNMEPDAYALRKARFPFMSWFDGSVISGIEGVAKPDRCIFDLLLRRYQLRPGRTVFIDDVAANVQAAVAAGIRGLLYTSPQRLREQLRGLGMAVA